MDSFKENIFQKYMELEKNYQMLKNKLEGKNIIDQNYKTELCKKFQATGYCPYGSKCRFAHGKNELIEKIQGTNYKKEKCKTFYEKGYCLYGTRCKFKHDERKYKDINFSYFYLRLFLLKYFGLYNSNYNFCHKFSNVCINRLSVFESLTQNYKDSNIINETHEKAKHRLNLNLKERNNNSNNTDNSDNSADDIINLNYNFQIKENSEFENK